MNKKLLRSVEDRRIAGICGGFASYFGLDDATWLRLIWALLVLVGGMSLWVYLICWIVIPEEPLRLPPENQ